MRPDDVLGDEELQVITQLPRAQEFVLKDIDHLFVYTYYRLDYMKLYSVFKRTNQETFVPCECHSLTQARRHVCWVRKRDQ